MGRRQGLCLALLLLIAQACATRSGGFVTHAEAIAACSESGVCENLALKEGVALSPFEACWVEMLRERCNVYDQCILKCLLAGEARNIGGSCWHVCGHIFVGVKGKPFLCPSTPTPGWEKCQELSNDPGAEPPPN